MMSDKQLVCLIDNPETFSREAWENGKMVASISANLLMSKDFKGHKYMDFRLSAGNWESGKVHFGNKIAMDNLKANKL
jgi:hypothetical protein